MPKARNYSILIFTGLGAVIVTVIVGAIAFVFGYGFGEQALEGVTPLFETGNPDGKPRNPNARGTIPLILEVDSVGETVPKLAPPNRLLVSSNPNSASIPVAPTPTPAPSPSPNSDSTPAPISTPTLPPPTQPTPPPVQAVPPAGSVVMNVLSASRQGGSVVLNVTMQNNSGQTVRFLYSFMDIRDNNGRVLSGSASGLPGELPPYSPVYSGVVRIPEIFLQGSSSVSISLPDYPSQKMWLRVSGVPLP
ncbi:MAG: hypothetical protein AB4040_06295 [Synechococcus sp.]